MPTLDLTPVVDTNVYADGDVLFDTIELANAFRTKGGRARLSDLLILDEADQGAAFDLILLDSNVSIGTLNAAVSITDANARKILRRVSVLGSDWYDMGGNRVADLSNLFRSLKAADGSTSLWVAGVSRGTPTFGNATDLKIKLGIDWSYPDGGA